MSPNPMSEHRLYVGVTDAAWFRFLKERKPDEINFWRPSASNAFRAVPPGSPFQFKLHSPDNFIVGGGHFLRYVPAPLSQVWPAFGEKNGAPDEATFRRSILGYSAKRGDSSPDPEVGCIILTQPFFFEREAWIEAPRDWAGSIQRGKVYDAMTGEGLRVWREVRARLEGVVPATDVVREPIAPEEPVWGGEYLRRSRLGQGAFRLMTLENYGRRCCVTGENPGAHPHPLRPWADGIAARCSTR